MTITLTIDNIDSLPDGGPTRYQTRNRSFEIGREQHLDWTLPDPGRYISGRHCEIRYENDGYWLYDISTNGVFVNGSSQRVKSPYRLENGERLAIGHYIINVAIEHEQRTAEAERPAASPAPPPAGGDIWSLDAPAPSPVDRREFLPPAAGRREADFSNQFLEFPDIQPPPPEPSRGASPWETPGTPPPPASKPARADPFVDPAAEASPPPFASPDETPPPVNPAAMRPMPGPVERPLPGVRIQPVSPAQAGASPPGRPATASRSGTEAVRFLDAFAAGAGISPDALRSRDPDQLAQEIGEAIRLTVDNLRQLLKARAAAKAMTKSASRTMISASDNNPLKFVPGTAEAIEVMFAHNRPGYLHAARSVEDGFGDLKRHELATYAAMQKALSRLMDEFAPETFEQKAAGGAFASKKSRAWDLFAAKWTERNAGENGLLDVFLTYFAEAYDEAAGKQQASRS
ncbi:MAG: type VI secretion system-associated FHA domain protein TagH [Rhizobiaceae bacterium]|nr:type VI secretion system-associated FHA domain protein TagH [Rhizobiaceae bacterium]